MSKFSAVLLHNYKNSIVWSNKCSYVSIKYDGWRMIWLPNPSLERGGVFMTRQGTLFDAPLDLYKECVKLSPSDILDGEMWKGYGFQSSDISSVEGSEKLRYMIFDCPNYGGVYSLRYNYLKDLFSKNRFGKLYLVEQELLLSSDLLFHELMNAEVRRGGEGIVIRNPDGNYDYGQRSINVLKLKPFDIITAVIKGHSDRDELTTYTKSLICTTTESEDGNLVEFRVTYKNVNPPGIGQEIKVRHSQYTTKGLPKFPVYLGVLGGELKTHLLPNGRGLIDDVEKVAMVGSESSERSEASKILESSEIPKLKLKKFKTLDCYKPPIVLEDIIPIDMKLKSLSTGNNNLGEYSELTVTELRGKLLPLNWLTLKSRSGGVYKIVMSKSGQIYCDCPSWKYQSLHPKDRSCKHCMLLQ